MKKSISVIITAVVLTVVLALSCMAATFVPSIEGKDLPDIIIGGLTDKDKNLVEEVKDDEVIIIPYSDADTTDNEEAKTHLNESYDELKKTEDLNDVCPGLDDTADSIIKGATAKDFSVTDLFFVDYTGTVPDSAKDGFLKVSVDMSKYDKDGDYVFMVKGADGTWKVLERDGETIYIPVDALGNAVAVLKLNDNIINKEDKPANSSPETGLSSNTTTAYIVAGCAVVLAAAVVVVAVVAKKKKYQ